MFEREKLVNPEHLAIFGIKEPVYVKRLSAGEKRDMENQISRANNVKVQGRDVTAQLSPGEMSLIYAKAYFKSGPFPVEQLDNQDWEVISLIEDAGDALNNPLVPQPGSASSTAPATN